MPYPRSIHTVHVERLGAELCVYDWGRNEVHALSPTAAAVWQACDGRTSLAEIAAALPATPNIADREALVALTLTLLEEAHLLETPTGSPVRRGTVSRRHLIARLGKAAALIPAVTSVVAPTPLQAQSAFSQVFAFTGAAQTFVVPAGVTRVGIAASGASGGGSQAGKGGRVTATVAVTPGEMLSIVVGGEGLLQAGGFNGGGPGGSASAGGGGGGSDVRRGSTKLVVAGGGGGASSEPLHAAGGAGGGITAAAGLGWPGAGGGGAGQTAGGVGGSPAGSPGSLGMGGAGAEAVNFIEHGVIGGGGGGGGFFGGGGGGASGGHVGSGGGGGGSSYTDPAATDVTHLSGDHLGPGHVAITWT